MSDFTTRSVNHSLAIFAFPALAALVPRVAVSFCVLEVQQILLKGISQDIIMEIQFPHPRTEFEIELVSSNVMFE